MKSAEFVKKWMAGHEPDTFVRNKYGSVIYSARHSSLNLEVFFEELLDDYIASKSPQPSEEVDIVYFNKKAGDIIWKKEFIKELYAIKNIAELFEKVLAENMPDDWDGCFSNKQRWMAEISKEYYLAFIKGYRSAAEGREVLERFVKFLKEESFVAPERIDKYFNTFLEGKN